MTELSTDISTINGEEASKNVIEFLCFFIDEKVRFTIGSLSVSLKVNKYSFFRLWTKLALEEPKVSPSG